LTELYLSDKRGRALFLVFKLYALGSMLHATVAQYMLIIFVCNENPGRPFQRAAHRQQ
jgi:hypothetical protein